jgi:hypothetical protein
MPNGKPLNDLLTAMGFAPNSATEPLYRLEVGLPQIWMSVEVVVPVEKLLTIQLKRDGYQPIYVQEVDLESDTAIISTVMSV